MRFLRRILLAFRLHRALRELLTTYSPDCAADLLSSSPVTGPLVDFRDEYQGLPGIHPEPTRPHTVSLEVNVDPYDSAVASGITATDATLCVQATVPPTLSHSTRMWRYPATIRLVVDGRATALRPARTLFEGLAWIIAADEVFCRQPQLAFGWRPTRHDVNR